jgi:hypothetical protein
MELSQVQMMIVRLHYSKGKAKYNPKWVPVRMRLDLLPQKCLETKANLSSNFNSNGRAKRAMVHSEAIFLFHRAQMQSLGSRRVTPSNSSNRLILNDP